MKTIRKNKNMETTIEKSVNTEHYNSIKDIIIDKKDIDKARYVEIYMITCSETGKSYVGQTVSHVLNHKRYRPYGAVRRFNAHVSEANSTKKCQCIYLNEDIVKYGAEKFEVETLLVCHEKDGNKFEAQMINEYKTLHPGGYNFTERSNVKCRDKVSAVTKYLSVGKLYKHNEDYLISRSTNNEQIGWRVRIDGIDTDFTSAKFTIDEKRDMALDFIQKVREQNNKAKHLVAGSS